MSLALRLDKKRIAIELDRVHLMTFPGRDEASAKSFPSGKRFPAGILLSCGDYLVGALSGGDNETMVLDHPRLGILKLPIDSVRLFIPGHPDVPADFGRYPLSKKEDILYQKGEVGFGEDFIRGTVDAFSDKGLSFQCSLGLVEFAFDRLNAVVIASDLDQSLQKRECIVLMAEETGKISGNFVGISQNRLVLKGFHQENLSIPIGAIDSIAFRRPRAVYLSDIDPVEVEETPFLGKPDDFLYPWRRDGSVTGRNLSCGRTRLAKGLGVHSRCALTYELKGEYESFISCVGISNEVLALRARGSMVFRVIVDGVKAFESPVLRGGDGALFLPSIPLQGAERLVLEADFADAFDSGDRGFWGHAILVRPK